jgi:hypothetical protein
MQVAECVRLLNNEYRSKTVDQGMDKEKAYSLLVLEFPSYAMEKSFPVFCWLSNQHNIKNGVDMSDLKPDGFWSDSDFSDEEAGEEKEEISSKDRATSEKGRKGKKRKVRKLCML